MSASTVTTPSIPHLPTALNDPSPRPDSHPPAATFGTHLYLICQEDGTASTLATPSHSITRNSDSGTIVQCPSPPPPPDDAPAQYVFEGKPHSLFSHINNMR